MEDSDADEAGELPAKLKRVVLFEDVLYSLLAEFEGLIKALREIGEGNKANDKHKSV